MIIGLGSDLIDIRRIERTIAQFGDRFTERCFTKIERAKADRGRNRIETYAKRYAAKEACAKALGTGFQAGVFWRDIGIVNAATGKPKIELSNGALLQLKKITPAGMRAVIDLSLTDEPPMAHAIVIISTLEV